MVDAPLKYLKFQSLDISVTVLNLLNDFSPTTLDMNDEYSLCMILILETRPFKSIRILDHGRKKTLDATF